MEKQTLLNFGSRLRTLRQNGNMTPKKLGSICDIDHSRIEAMEKGKINISLITLSRLANGLNVPLEELMDFPVT